MWIFYLCQYILPELSLTKIQSRAIALQLQHAISHHSSHVYYALPNSSHFFSFQNKLQYFLNSYSGSCIFFL
jgi:hypothetical protein